jgi:hypothetical protein
MAFALHRADIGRKVGLALGLGDAEEAVEEDILRRDGRVGLELEDEMPVRLLKRSQRLACLGGDIAGMRGQRRRRGDLGHVERAGAGRHRS